MRRPYSCSSSSLRPTKLVPSSISISRQLISRVRVDFPFPCRPHALRLPRLLADVSDPSLVPIASLPTLLRPPVLLATVCLIAASACSKDDGDGTPASAAAATTKSGGPDAKAGAQGAPGGRRTNSIVLAAGDVKTVERGTIEAGVQVSGDLRAIEEAVVR